MSFSVPSYIKHDKNPSVFIEDISCRQKKKRKQSLEKLKNKICEKLEAKRRKRKIRFSAPLYDDVYFKGIKALDSSAGEEIK